MPRKKAPKFDLDKIIEEDETIKGLKKKYFKLIPHEQIPRTPKTTKILDDIEKEINNRKKQIKIEYEDSK